MPQVVNGLLLGSPGPAGSAPIFILYGSGAPSTNPDPNLTGAQLGSLYIDYATPALWFKTASGWTQITIP